MTTRIERLRELEAKAAPPPWIPRPGEDGPNYELERAARNALPSLFAAVDALYGVVYCADCWDNPEHALCAKHLEPARAALAALDNPAAHDSGCADCAHLTPKGRCAADAGECRSRDAREED